MISNVVYHFSSLHAALSILTENQFNLTFITDTDFIDTPKQKYYYLSTTRSRMGSYHVNSYIGVLFKLNGQKLQSNYIGKPVDHWGREFRKVAPSKNEMEDRIWNDEPYIKPANRYIDEMHVYFDTTFSENEYDKRRLRKLLIEAKRKNIPTFVYTRQTSANLLDKRKAIPLDKIDLRTPNLDKEYTRSIHDPLNVWLEFYIKDKLEHLSIRAKKQLRSFDYPDAIDVFLADVHNAKKGTPALHNIVKILKQKDWTTKDYFKFIKNKWEHKN